MIIFDFDQTLVDTSPVEAMRAARDWKGVMSAAPRLQVYKGVTDLIQNLSSAGVQLAIVTKSPDMVPKYFIKQHEWPIKIIIGYHHVQRRKPDPEGLILAMQQGNAVAAKTCHVGDQAEDTAASRAAGVTALGAAWGLADASALRASSPDHLFETVSQLSSFLKQKSFLAKAAG